MKKLNPTTKKIVENFKKEEEKLKKLVNKNYLKN